MNGAIHYGQDTVPISGTNVIITGGVDDVWVTPSGEYIIVDYKATSKEEEVSLDADWQIGYKRQMEIYQWLFRQNGFKVSDTGYFVYCNGNTDKEAFDGKLEFEVTVIPYTGSTVWIEDTLLRLKNCLDAKHVPQAKPDCDYCRYRAASGKVLFEASASVPVPSKIPTGKKIAKHDAKKPETKGLF